ncbi:MAG: DUF6020 family protein [Eubacteriales bacterium]
MDNRNQKRKVCYILPLAILFSCMQVIGSEIEKTGEFLFQNPWNYIEILIMSCIFFAVIWFLWILLEKYQVNVKTSENKTINWKWVWLAIGSCHLIVLLAAYPGFCCYDFTTQINQVLDQEFTTHHPLLHTLLMGSIITKVGELTNSLNFGGFVYCFLQMVIVSGCFTFILKYLYGKGIPKIIVMISACYYALFPTNAMFSICTTKDSLFTIVFVCNLIFMRELLDNREKFLQKKQNSILFIGTAIIAGLLRNNTIYVYVVGAVILWIATKGYRKYITIVMGIIIGGIILCNQVLLITTDATKGKMTEMLSVPAQQIARAVSVKGEDFFTEEELNEVYTVLLKDGIDRYVPYLSDPVKAELRVGFNSSLIDFVEIWIKIGLKAPLEYLNATAVNTYQAWYPNGVIDGYCEANKPAYEGSQTCYFAAIVEEPLTLDSKIPWLYDIFYSLSRQLTFYQIPVISLLFSIGFWFWCMLFSLVYAIYKKNKANSIMLLFILLLYMTGLLGPIVVVRYYLVLFWAAPVFIGFLFTKPSREDILDKNIME